MKNLLPVLFVLLAVTAGACKDNPKKEKAAAATEDNMIPSDDKKYPIMQFEQTEYDFGKIEKGKPVSHVFKFTNTGNAPLVITDAQSTCGCTVPEKPEQPIAPGETGEIKVTYNASGIGQITKMVMLTTNTKEGREQLKISALVE